MNFRALGERVLLWVVPAVAAALALNVVVAFAEESDQSVFGPEAGLGASDSLRPPGMSRWSLSYENDFFVPGGRDQDYTYGLTFSYSEGALDPGWLHAPLLWLDGRLGIDEGIYTRSGYEGGLYGFTPEDITIAEPNPDDRPYASLIYVSASQERVGKGGRHVWRSQISYGLLGTELVGQVQEEFHRWIGNDEPAGWSNQISNGGEPTARYALSRLRLMSAPSDRFEWRQTQAVSVGYLTEASWALSFRAGKLNSSWYQFSPELASYAEMSSRAQHVAGERFFWGGVAVKARAYNVFLQGQFRDSVVTYDSGELNHFILEAWAGYTHSFANGYYASYGVRGHSAEIKEGAASRNVVWGGLMLGRRW